MYITDNIPRLAHNQGSQAGLAAVASLLDPDLTVQFANRSFDDTFAVTPEDTPRDKEGLE
jgi:hypothetical protein